jgi:co-chaperonin GroES (HSP10)
MINAIADKIIVEYLREARTEAGILLPDSGQDPQGYGRVLSVGSEVEHIKEGDILIFHTRAGMDFILDRRVQKCLKDEEVYGIVDNKELENRLEALEFAGKSESENLVKPARGGVVIAP